MHRLLDVIAGRKDPAGLRQGTVRVNGKAVTSELRLSSAYVVQVGKDTCKVPYLITLVFLRYLFNFVLG